ncbi:MAG: UDP-glucose 4-epimerase [Chloroflexota bacterium]|jgi:UDP-glucose 4-epimerase|nr:UDP-glucose 4-epimerase [Chloroflexota bacterium]
MKVLVTGGAGFIGSNLADQLVEDGHDVVVVDDLSSGKRSQVPAGANFYHMDVESRWLDRVIERERPEAVCHLAAQISVSRSVREPLFDARVNIIGSIGLLAACQAHGVGRVVFASTGGAIYGDADTIPTPETYIAAPVSPYGASKLSFEHYLHVYRAVHGLSSVALRFANVYGPRQDPHGEAGVVAIFSRALLRGDKAVINGDGKQTRDYVFVGDVVAALTAALRSDVTGSYNVGTASETDVNALYRMIAAAAGTDADAEHAPARPGEQLRSCVAVDRIAADLGWQPRVALAEGIPLTVDYFRKEAVATPT